MIDEEMTQRLQRTTSCTDSPRVLFDEWDHTDTETKIDDDNVDRAVVDDRISLKDPGLRAV